MVRVGALLGMGGDHAVTQGAAAAAAAAAHQQAHVTGWLAAAQTSVTQLLAQIGPAAVYMITHSPTLVAGLVCIGVGLLVLELRYLLSVKLRNERRVEREAKQEERLRQAEEKERKRRLQMAVAAARTKPKAAAKGKKPSVEQTTAAAPFSPLSSAWPRQPMDEVSTLAEAAAAAVVDSRLEEKKKADVDAAKRKEMEAAELEKAKAALKDQTMIDALIMDEKRAYRIRWLFVLTGLSLCFANYLLSGSALSPA